MEKPFKELTYEEYQKLYEEIGRKNLNLQSEIAKSITTAQLDLYMKTLDFLYRIISSIGIFAGFGFTALGFVHNFWLFALGEGILISLSLAGLYFIPKIYIKEYRALEKMLYKYRKHVFIPRNKVLEKIVQTYKEQQKIQLKDLENLNKYDKRLLKLTNTKEATKKPFLEKYISIGMVTCATGLILLLISFLNI